MIGLTQQQKRLLSYIEKYTVANNGVSPSFEEMKGALNLKSKSGVHRLITALEERGFIRRLPNRARALVVLPENFLRIYTTTELQAEINRRELEVAS